MCREPSCPGPVHAQIDVTMNVYTEVSDAKTLQALRGSEGSSDREHSCTSLLSAVGKGPCLMTRKGPVTWVGVAGFEPAASSSRTKRAAKLRYTPSTA